MDRILAALAVLFGGDAEADAARRQAAAGCAEETRLGLYPDVRRWIAADRSVLTQVTDRLGPAKETTTTADGTRLVYYLGCNIIDFDADGRFVGATYVLGQVGVAQVRARPSP